NAVQSSGGGAPAPAPPPPPRQAAYQAKGHFITPPPNPGSPQGGGMGGRVYLLEERERFPKREGLDELETTEFQSDFDHTRSFLESAKQKLLELERGNRPEEIEAARAELKEVEAQREQLYLDWKRNTSLKTGNALAQRDYEQAQSSFLAMD